MSNLSPRALAMQQAHGPGPVDWERVAEIAQPAIKMAPPTTAETYGPALLTEEIGEIVIVLGSVLQLIGKAGRFGMDTPGVRDPLTGIVDMAVTPRTKLVEEAGDLIAAIDYICHRGILDIDAVYQRRSYKLRKLLDPNSKDNLGRRLAP